MSFGLSVKEVLQAKRMHSKTQKARYERRAVKDVPLSEKDRAAIFQVCVSAFNEHKFGPPSLQRYVELQREWGKIGDRIKLSVIDQAERVVSNEARASKHFIPGVAKAWCQVAGCSFDRFPVNELRFHSQVMSKLMWKMSCFVRFTGQRFSDALQDLEGFDARWAENPTLTMLVCVLPVVERSLGPECFKNLKSEWMKRGGSDADFRWLAKRSRSWLNDILVLTRTDDREVMPVLLIAARLRLRGCHLRHSIVKAIFAREMSVRRGSGWREKLLFEALRRSLASHDGPVSRFNPMRVQPDQQDGLNVQKIRDMQDWFESLERSPEIDRLMASATLEGLQRRSEEWHEQVRRDRRKARRNLVFAPIDIIDWWEHDIRFEWLGTGEALLDEGDELQHCVADYDVECFDELYRVYRVTGRNLAGGAVRATVGFARETTSDAWTFDQAQGSRENRVPHQEVEMAARRLLREMNRVIERVSLGNLEAPQREQGDDANFALAA